MNAEHCHYCPKTDDLRPYGPGGSMVCFACATTPERENETKAAFLTLLEANEAISEDGVTLIAPGTNGPVPYDPQVVEDFLNDAD